MTIKNNLNRVSNIINFTGVAIDGFNWYAYHSKNKKLLYASLAISTVGATLDFYTAIKSPKKFAKVFSTFTFASTLLTSAKRIKSLRNY